MNPGFLLFLVIFIAKVIWMIMRSLPSQPTRRYRTRPRSSEAQNSTRPASFGAEIQAIESSLAKVADRLHGDVDMETVVPSIVVQRANRWFRVFVSQQHGVQSIRMVCHWPDEQFRLRIFPDQKRNKAWKSFQYLNDIQIGRQDFDREFVIQGSDSEAIKRLLTASICKRIWSHVRNAHGRILISVGGGECEYGGKATKVLGTSQVVAIVNNFMAIHARMLNSFAGGSAAGAQLVFVEKANGVCMVCGDAVNYPTEGVSCDVCLTRHHRDCWNYIGKCSTYGCHSRRATHNAE
ncbi:MAG: hypothetical protein ACI87E_002293 [Mariniblastus sp.]|jgi:hypothetical protein